jgi:hypothetical protein
MQACRHGDLVAKITRQAQVRYPAVLLMQLPYYLQGAVLAPVIYQNQLGRPSKPSITLLTLSYSI